MKTKKDEEIQNKFINLDKKLKEIDKLSLNELKILYNEYYFDRKNYQKYLLKDKKRIRLTNILKFLYLLLLTIIINLIAILIPETAFLFVIALAGLYEMTAIDKVNEILINQKYDAIIKLINDHIIKAQNKEIKQEDNITNDLDSMVTYDYKENKTLKLVRSLTKGDDR